MAKLTVQIPDGQEAAYEFDEAHVTVGRNDDNGIAIPHGSLSGSHAQMIRNPDGSYTLSDLGSTNGTFVNGEQITEVQLPSYAEVVFGQVAAYYVQSADAEPAAAAAGMGGVASAFSVPELSGMGRPANFRSVSPFPKHKSTKDPIGAAATLFGILSIVSALGLVATVFLLFQ